MRNAYEVVEWRRLGVAALDSGILLIGDACYFKDWKPSTPNPWGRPDVPLDGTYGEACRAALGPQNGGEVLLANTHGTGVSFAFSQCLSGVVWAGYDEDGIIREVRVLPEDDGEEEDGPTGDSR